MRQEKYIKKNQYKIILIVSLSCLLFMNNTLQKPPTLSLFQQIKKKWTRLERQSTLKQKNIETEIRKWDSWVLEFIKDLKFRRELHETAVGICRGNHIILPQRKYRTRKDMIREIYLTEYIKAQDKKAKTYPTPNCTFPTPKGAKWEEVRITFHSDKAFFHSMSIFLLQVNACLHIMTSVQNLIYQSIEEFSHFSFPAHFLNHCPCHEQGLLPTSSGAHCVVPCPLSLF